MSRNDDERHSGAICSADGPAESVKDWNDYRRLVADAARRGQLRGATLSRFVNELVNDEIRRSQEYQKALRAALAEKPLEGLGPFLSREELYAERLRRNR